MGSSNHKHNRRLRESIHRSLDRAMNLLAEGNRDSASRMLDAAYACLSHAPWNGSLAWSAVFDRCWEMKTRLQAPCNCWFCCCAPEQKEKIGQATHLKQADLSSVYLSPETNFTGAYAEVVFGVRFGLQMNLTRGYDRGKDFEVPSPTTPSGIITIDIKGTAHCEVRNGIPHCQFPYQSEWKKKPDHIYVLLHVAGRKHVFFRGFAFGTDPYESQFFQKNGRLVWDNAPRLRTSLNELERILAR